ncbi:MAG: EamA family transporter [Candidatus Woesearchaeota archaeon]|jgi:drug/metabolite transporter (DMT)-like permease|nr:EamA family transporter [Candidatus Woesearchaeota archaeon]MDP7323894.1 EamA family transporter [Candidatus Woesearchaeota archaeon]MDP7458227.1 EamA family transporter [Candidatus Woesearchaeota archaeon]
MTTAPWSIGAVLVAAFIGSFGAIYFKRAAKDITRNIKSFINAKFILGVFLYVVSTVIFIVALSAGELSVLYPLVATVYIWVALLSIWLLKEKMNKYKWLSIALIIAGIIFIGLGS